MNMAKRAIGVGLFTGGLLLAAPAGTAFADNALSDAVGGLNGAVQNVVNQNNNGLQGITAINNAGLQNGVASLNSAAQAGVPATQSLLTAANGFVQFAVQGLLGK